jgi:uncharacterized cupredoxin-like copper-binding protein
MTKLMGGVGAIAPGLSAQALLDLSAGHYVILCLMPSPSDNVAHYEKGMIKALTVQNSTTKAKAPSADLTVTMKDYTYELPESLPAGPVTIKVVNNGPEFHEFNILKLSEGKTLNDVMNFFKTPDGPPPFIPVGGMNGLDMGGTGYVELNLEPGNYVAICNIPSPKANGLPHFTVAAEKSSS